MPPRHIRQLPLHERIKDGRIFEISRRTTTGIIYLRCRTKHCGGTAKMLCSGEIVSGRNHSSICFEDRRCQLKADFLHALKTALQRNFWRLKVLYETVAALYPHEITVLLPYNSLKDTLKHWRKQMYPPNPSCLQEMATQLEQAENSRMLEYDVGYLRSQRILDSLGKIHIILYDPQFVQSEFQNVSRILLDATYKSKPNLQDVYQLFTVLGVTYDHALPFAHILMSSKTEAAYRAVLTKVASLIRVEGVKIVMSDFEQALRNASKAVFSSAHVTGCNVHYDRALLKKIKTLKLSRLIRDDEVARLFVKKIMALAYLPQELIQEQYEELKTTLTAALARTFQPFLTYYERQWLRIVKPSGFSVHGLSRRTNNATESYNSVLGDKLGLHPGPWAFLVHLLKLTSNARDDVNSLKLNKRIKRQPRYSTTYKRNELVKVWKQLYSGDITAAEFLTLAASLKGHIRQRLEVQADNISEDEAEMHESPEAIPAREDPDYDAAVFEGLRFDDDEEQSIRSDHEDDRVDALIDGFEAGEQREARVRPNVEERRASLERPEAEGQAEEQREAQEQQREAQERQQAQEQQREAEERHQAEEQQRQAQERREAEEQQREAQERREAEEQQREAQERREVEEQQREAQERREVEEQQREAQRPREAEEQRGVRARREIAQHRLLYWQRQREQEEQREAHREGHEPEEQRETQERQHEVQERRQAEEQRREAQERQQAQEQQREAQERHQAEEQQREAQERREAEEQREAQERREAEEQRDAQERQREVQERREAEEQREAQERQREVQERRQAEEQQREAQERQQAQEQQREAQERREAEEQQREAQERREAGDRGETREAITIVIVEDDDLHSLQGIQARQDLHGRQAFEVNGTVDLTADTDSDIAPEPEQEPGSKVSRNKNKNRRKKRRRQMLKAGGIDPQIRPHGHKRRRKNNQATCKICLDRKSTYVFCPCGHNCACESCANVFINGYRQNQSQPFEQEEQYKLKCPQCRQKFTQVIRVYN